MERRRKNLCSAAVFVFFSLYIAFESYRLGLCSWKQLGPVYFPFVASAALGIIGLSLLIRTVVKEPLGKIRPKRAEDGEPINWRYIVLTVAGMLVYVAIFDWLGFVASTLLMLVFLVRAVARASWRLTIITALSITVASYLLFELALDAGLPKGILENLF
jgi:putative tricarboxylic transport membrane protein